jgi:hypothetical protein
MFDGVGLDWWVDCGTLLGIHREGRILPTDDDIDVSVWAQRGGWGKLESRFRQAGYRIQRRGFRGMLYKYRLVRHGLLVDVQIWRPDGEFGWSPARALRPLPFPAGSLRWWVARTLRSPVTQLWSRTDFLPRRSWGVRLVHPLGFRMNTWRVPANLLNGDRWSIVGGGRVKVPSDPDSLLTYHYGDWRTPNSDWNFWEDDPAMTWSEPPELPRTPPFLSSRHSTNCRVAVCRRVGKLG